MDRTILITGATDGLGHATAQELAARGATVLLTAETRRSSRRSSRTSCATTRLLDLLRASAPARIVNKAYARGKLAQIMFTFALAERLRADGEHGVTVVPAGACLESSTSDCRRARRGVFETAST